MLRWRKLCILCLSGLVVLGTPAKQAQGGVVVDPRLAPYTSRTAVKGRISSIGSDTMVLMMERWTKGFCTVYPEVQVRVESNGSSTSVPALITGAANFGPMSRKLRPAELEQFVDQFGYRPVQVRTSVDMIAVYVHTSNPLNGMTLQQVDAIFSNSRYSGSPKSIETWGDLGLTGEWAQAPIVLYGRNESSGTYSFFRNHALFGGEYKDSVTEEPTSQQVIDAVAGDRFGIGYSGIGYLTDEVRAVPLSDGLEDGYIAAVAGNAYSGHYPLSRFLYLTLNVRPASRIDALRREFLRYIFSQEGQQAVVDAGFLPVPATVCDRELRVLGLEADF